MNHFQHTNITTQTTSKLNLDNFQKSLYTTHTSLTLNTDLNHCWAEHLYDRDKMEYKDTYNKPNDQIEIDDLITDAHVSDALRYALIDL